jgi:hypothetical protein
MNKINTIQIVQLLQSAFFVNTKLLKMIFPNKKKCELYFINI